MRSTQTKVGGLRNSESERSLIGMIADVQNGWAKMFRERTEHIGLSRSQWRVLSAMSGRPGLTQTELADLIGIGRAPTGKIIDRLEAQNWVERRSDPQDRRVNRLFITRDFRPIAEPTRSINRQLTAELLSDVDAEDQEIFINVLQHLHQKLGFDGAGVDLDGEPARASNE